MSMNNVGDAFAASGIAPQNETPVRGTPCTVIVKAPLAYTVFGMRLEHDEAAKASFWKYFDPSVGAKVKEAVQRIAKGEARDMPKELRRRPLPSLVFHTWWSTESRKGHGASVLTFDGRSLRLQPAELTNCKQCGTTEWLAFWRLKNDRKAGCPKCGAYNEKGKQLVLERAAYKPEPMPSLAPELMTTEVGAALPELVSTVKFDTVEALAAFRENPPVLGGLATNFQRANPNLALYPLRESAEEARAGQFVLIPKQIEVGKSTIETLSASGLIPKFDDRQRRPARPVPVISYEEIVETPAL